MSIAQYYAALVNCSITVYVLVAVFIIVTVYISIAEAFPAAGAAPPIHLGVTETPSICNPV